MWLGVDPIELCQKHLGGERFEIGWKLLASLRREHSIRGYLEDGLLEPQSVVARFDALTEEGLRRGYKYRAPLAPDASDLLASAGKGSVDRIASRHELRRRCPACRKRMNERQRRLAA